MFVNSVFRWLFGPHARSRRVLALVDLYEHTRGGHFGTWICWFAREFAKRFDDVYVITPKPHLTRKLFEDVGGPPQNVSFYRIPRKLRKNFDLSALRKVGRARWRNLSVFFMWGYDLVKLPPPKEEPPVPWATFAGISWLRRGHLTQSAELEKQLQSLFQSSRSCRAFLQPDQYLMDGAEKAIWIPDLEDVSRPERPSRLAERIRHHGAGRFCVGAFGIITGFRCLNELVPLAQAQPDVRFVVAGRILEETVAPELLPLLQDGALPNLLVVPGFIPTEKELNDAIAAADAVFIDGKNYPVQSGVVCKAIEMGRCILTPRSNSWTNDFLLEWRVGIVYESRLDPLVAAWVRWKSDGGEVRSRAASNFVRDPVAVAACFDRVSYELTKDWEWPTT